MNPKGKREKKKFSAEDDLLLFHAGALSRGVPGRLLLSLSRLLLLGNAKGPGTPVPVPVPGLEEVIVCPVAEVMDGACFLLRSEVVLLLLALRSLPTRVSSTSGVSEIEERDEERE